MCWCVVCAAVLLWRVVVVALSFGLCVGWLWWVDVVLEVNVVCVEIGEGCVAELAWYGFGDVELVWVVRGVATALVES